jgi:hypothetical protein
MTTTSKTPLLFFFDTLSLIHPCHDFIFRWAESVVDPTPEGYDPTSTNWGPKPIWKEGVCDCDAEAKVVARMVEQAVPLTVPRQAQILVILPKVPEDFVPSLKESYGPVLYRIREWMGEHEAFLLEVPGCTPLAIEPNMVELRECAGYYGVQNRCNSIYSLTEVQVNGLLALAAAPGLEENA